MSRIGKKPIEVPGNVTVDIVEQTIKVKGPLGEDSLTVLECIGIEKIDNVIKVVKKDNSENDKKIDAFYGLFRTLISNIFEGVSKGFEKNLEIVGVGYRANQENASVKFQLGFSHDIIFTPPEGVTVEVKDSTKIKVKGINKQKVGQVAANIRKLRPPEPYKGKGIKYKNEYIRKKAGKTGK